MTRVSNLVAVAATVLPSLVAAADDTCTFFLPEWECDVCGGYDASAPIVCAPYNATFDDLTANQPVGNYKSAEWKNFIIATDGGVNDIPPHVNPVSPPNYALLPANNIGNMSFTGQFPFGRLHSLHYACAEPITNDPSYYLASPTSCTVTMSATCQPTVERLDPSQETVTTMTLEYVVQGTDHPSNMTYAEGFSPETGTCFSYAFSATSEHGVSVDLLLDEALYMSYNQGFAK